MKNTLLYISLIVVVFLTACSFMIANADEENSKKADKAKPLKLGIGSIIEEYDAFNLAVHYPITEVSRVDQTMLDHVKKRISAFKQESYRVKKEGEKDDVHELHIDFELLQTDGKFFVVRFDEEAVMGESDRTLNTTVINYDVKKGSKLSLDDVFKNKSEALQFISSYTNDYLKDRMEADEAWVGEKTAPYTANFEEFALMEDRVTFYLTNEASGQSFVVPIPFDELDEWLKDSIIDQPKLALGESDLLEAETTVSGKSEQPKEMEESEGGKKVALTFEDGPHPKVTSSILSTLQEYDEQATFFVLGKRAHFYPDIVKQMAEEGHEVGNHTWSHRQLTNLSPTSVERQMEKTDDLVEELTGTRPDLVRFPYRDYDQQLQSNIAYPVIGETIDVQDWKGKTKEAVVGTVMKQVEDGAIITMHDLYPTTAETLDLLVQELQSEGYELVTVSELLGITSKNISEFEGQVINGR
ncbi:polysaccharide deacetylase family protein [Thalassobacillus hwangdonensis]|uniref:Polysaccharide deacetylase family protein n=1 Tax=Thalassobacillus hwangdonensis TaxID=546108 RepID=A0ABW3L1K4_9BACI